MFNWPVQVSRLLMFNAAVPRGFGQLRRALLALALFSLSAAALSDALEIQSGYSALWHNPERNGEGWMLEVLDESRAIVYWYTFDEAGHQRWLTGAGEIDGASIIFPEMLVTHGARFGVDFDPDAVVYEPVGRLTLLFDDCDTGEATYQMFGQTGTIAIERLTRTMAAGCGQASSGSITRQAAFSGSWFDPARSGEGFALQWLDRGEALLSWFTYDALGNQQWMVGVGRLDEAGRLLVPTLHAARGGRFGAAFDPDDVELVDWGGLIVDLSCTAGTFEYHSVFPEFGSGEYGHVPLTRLAGLECPLFMPARAAIEDARWDNRFTVAGLAGPFRVPLIGGSPPGVHDLAAMPDGTMLAAGSFRWSGQAWVPPLVRGTATSGDWQALPQAMDLSNATVTALASDASQPLAMAVAWPRRILLVEGDELREIGRYFSGQVHSLSWFDGELWAAGSFTMSDGGPSNLAVWNGQAWRVPPGGSPDGPVYGLQTGEDGLYVGGRFNQLAGIEADHLALWDGLGWQGFSLPAPVHAVASTGDELFAAGAFGVKRWNGGSWEDLGHGLATNDNTLLVSDIHFFQNQLYAVGCFRFANGGPDTPGSVAANGIARWNGLIWESLDDGSAWVGSPYLRGSIGLINCPSWPAPDRTMEMQRLASAGDYLYVGGTFAGIDGQSSQGLIAFDGEQFRPIGTAGLGLSGEAGELAQGPDGTVFVRGATHFGPEAVESRMATLNDNNGWMPIETPLPPYLQCDGAGQNMAVAGDGRLFMACTDYSADPGRSNPSLWRYRVIYLEDEAWHDIDNVGDLPRVHTLTSDPRGNIWIAGGQQGAFGNGQGYIARLVGDRFEVFEDQFDGRILRFAFAPDAGDDEPIRLVVSGFFSRIGSIESAFMAHWQGDEWVALQGLEQEPLAIEYGRQHILVSSSAGWNMDNNLTLGAWDGEAWVELATPENGFPDFGDARPHFSLIRQAGDRLFLVGRLPDDPPGAGNVFVYEQGNLGLLAGDLAGAAPAAMLLAADAIIFGGGFVEADPDGEPVSSMGIARLAWD